MQFTLTSLFLTSAGSAAIALWWAGVVVPWWQPLIAAWLAVFAVTLATPPKKLPVVVEPGDYSDHGLGPLKETATSTSLYLDLLKRVLINVVYHEQSHQISLTRSAAEGRTDPQLSHAFSLRCRCLGEDVSLNTLTMVGLHRLNNIQQCVEAVLKDNVAGDLIETGCAKGWLVHLHEGETLDPCTRPSTHLCTHTPTRPSSSPATHLRFTGRRQRSALIRTAPAESSAATPSLEPSRRRHPPSPSLCVHSGCWYGRSLSSPLRGGIAFSTRC